MLILIDNYDSFTWNLSHYLSELGVKVKVLRNDIFSAEKFLSLAPTTIVISPGPCDPDRSGICLDLIKLNAGRKKVIPTLGICLGHQCIGQAFGGRVIRAPYPMHGKITPINHNGVDIFKDIPNNFAATRYHSLIVEKESLPSCLRVTARSEDDLIMGIEHKELPFYGLQFHPESIATEHGHKLLDNFLQRYSNA